MTKHDLLKTAKPILFNTDMVRAILDGKKTVTRRVVKLKYDNTHLKMKTDKYGTRLVEIENEVEGVHVIRHDDGTTSRKLLAYIEKEPPYKPGDILYVRETFYKDTGRYMYKANYSDKEKFYIGGNEVQIKWRPSIHMPKEAAHIFLKVKSVRVERLQDITETQACNEGADFIKPTFCENLYCDNCASNGECQAYVHEFKLLWDSTIKKSDLVRYGWKANPWVWVVEFERVEVE